jgi:hypothetical protein
MESKQGRVRLDKQERRRAGGGQRVSSLPATDRSVYREKMEEETAEEESTHKDVQSARNA